MEVTTLASYAFVIFYIVISEFGLVLSTKFLNEFKLERIFFNFTCPAEDTIFHVNEVKSQMTCTLMCTKVHPCFGVFFTLSKKECVGCNYSTGLLPLDGTLFYRQVPLNIAKGKNTTVSSTYDARYQGSYAVDGNTGYPYYRSEYETSHWWRVDLDALYVVTEIKIRWWSIQQWSRRRQNLAVLAGISTDSLSTVAQTDEVSFTPYEVRFSSFKFTYGSLKTRYVEARMEDTGDNTRLLIKQAEVFGIPA